MKIFKPTNLYCFSPPVMLATFLIEISFAIYILWRYKLTPISRLVIAILIFLAMFQGTEYLLCGGLGLNGGLWSRIGYVSITMLPPLGLHLAHKIAGQTSKLLVPLAYLTAAAFIFYFVFISHAISGHTCYANYAVFSVHSGASWLFALYYYSWLIISTISSLSFRLVAESQRVRHALLALAIGYLSFILPTTTINLIDPATVSGIPSIMCGFAVIFAFLLVGRIMPVVANNK